MDKRCLSILFLLLFSFPFSGTTQNIIVDDNFEDGNITAGTVWSGDENDFAVVDENGNYRLRLNASEAGSSHLVTSSAAAYGSWELFVRLDFSTLSGSNNLTVFLISDISDLAGDVNGYAIVAGETGSEDVFELVRYDEGSETETILSGTTNINEGGDYRVKMERSSDGRWMLYVGKGYGSTPVQEASGRDNTHSGSEYFGFLPAYTATRSDKFFFDDVVISKSPIEVTGVNVVSNREVQVFFTEDVDPATVANSDFIIDPGIGSPDGTKTQDRSVILTYHTPLPADDYTITINNIDDLSGTTIPENSTVRFSLFDPYEAGDIIINEFMYDEPAGLAEYVEIRNISPKRFNLANWKFGDANPPSVIDSDTLILDSGGFLVISSDTTALYNTFGSKSYVKMGAFPALNNRNGDAVRLLTDSGILVDSLFYMQDWGGENVALERRSPAAASTFPENWGDSPNNFGGTPGEPNEIPDDTEPPVLAGLNLIDNRTLSLLFNERLEEKSASSEAGYLLTGAIGVDSALFSEPDTVRLYLASDLQNGATYKLTVTGVSDIFGNVTAEEETTFTHYAISAADSGNIFINEYMSDPPDGFTEYIELYNPTSKSFDLNGWTINDNTGTKRTITESSFVLPPGAYALIAPDNTILNLFPDALLLVMGSRFPSLNNGGDDIVVRGSNGTLLDSLRYSPKWGGNGVAMERKSTAVSGVFMENWAESTGSIGSPGFPNTVGPDQKAPDLIELNVLGASIIRLVFSETLESVSATEASNYALSPEIGLQVISVNKDTVTLFLSREMLSGVTYEVTVKNLRDLFGNILPLTTRSIRYVKLSTVQAGNVVINEILYRPDGSDNPEFVELYNRSSKNFNLDGWQLGDGAGPISLEGAPMLEASSYLVLTGNRSFAASSDEGVYLTGFPSLNDNADAVYIRSETGITIDSLFYDDNWNAVEGVSMERRDPAAASNDPFNWSSSSSTAGFSAGKQNSTYRPDESPPEVVFSTSLSENIFEARFNEFIRLTPDLRFLIGGSKLQIDQFDSNRGNRIFLRMPVSKTVDAENSYTLSVQNLSDVKGNITVSASVPVSGSLKPGSVVINEIMYNPLSDPDDNRPDQSEYIELRNRSESAVSLEGFILHDAPDENGNVRPLLPVNAASKWIPPNGILLVYPDTSATFARSRTAIFFGLENDLSTAQTVRIDRNSLSLASTADAIYLADSTGTTVDSVYYDEDWQNPNLPDTRGIALERINPAGPGNDESNWSSSISDKGGTPGRENTIYQTPGTRQDKIGIRFDPNPFSPDDDGFEDHLFINYKLDQADYLLKVRIFDRYGRQVRKLADGQPSGFDGSLIWDGRTDGGTKNRIGIYIVLFEAYNSSSGKNRTFKEVVVLVRRM